MKEALELARARYRALGRKQDESVRFIDSEYRVSPGGSVEHSSPGAGEAPEKEAIIILHYLLSGAFKSGGGGLIDFKNLPGGLAYNPVFSGRVHGRLLPVFGSDHELFAEAAEAIGGEKAPVGDAGAGFTVLPGVHVYIGLFRGDEDFGPGCKILFNSGIEESLPTEDIIIICEMLAKKLAKAGSLEK